MKIQVLTDLHIEHGGQVPEHHRDADVIVLAGDLAPPVRRAGLRAAYDRAHRREGDRDLESGAGRRRRAHQHGLKSEQPECEGAAVGKKRWHRETEADREALWPLSREERYISVDIEADGPVPGLHSMLSLGAAAYNAWGQCVGKFSANLETLPDATTDERTMAWWATQPEA